MPSPSPPPRSSPGPTPTRDARPPDAPIWLLGAIVGLAAALRLARASSTSLWLDEFHTLHHASAPSVGALLGGLLGDNHPPLSFLLVRASIGLFGDSALALRAPALLAGVAGVALTAGLARRLPGAAAQLAAPFALAASTLHLDVSADARMYALLALAVLGLLHGLVRLFEGRGGMGWVALWTAVGLHTHYHIVHSLLALTGAIGLLALLRPGLRRPAGRAALAGLLGVLVSLPWILGGLVPQLGHDLPPGGSSAGPARLAAGYVHLLFHDLSVEGALAPTGAAGRALHRAFVAAGIGACLLAAWAAVSPAASRRPGTSGPGAGSFDPTPLLVACAFGAPALAALAAMLAPRAGFHWTYLATACGPFCLLLARGTTGTDALAPLRRAGTWVVLGAAALLAVIHTQDPGPENYRLGVRTVLEHAGPADAVAAVDWGPKIFPQGLAWRYYAPRLVEDPARLPVELPVNASLGLEDPLGALDHDRVFVLGRSLPSVVPTLDFLRKRYPRERALRVDEGIFVLLFTSEGRPRKPRDERR